MASTVATVGCSDTVGECGAAVGAGEYVAFGKQLNQSGALSPSIAQTHLSIQSYPKLTRDATPGKIGSAQSSPLCPKQEQNRKIDVSGWCPSPGNPISLHGSISKTYQETMPT
jgi:hypothetical protein